MKSVAPLFILAMGCTEGSGGANTPKQHMPKPDQPTLTVLVSNQSFDLPTVDIAVRIDGELAITGDFHVEGQHTWIPFDFDIAPGNRQISVTSTTGEATLDKTFEMDDRKWAVVNFWYYETGSPEPTPQQFSFVVSDEQPLFD